MLNCKILFLAFLFSLTPSLPLVPDWQDRFPSSDQTASQPADRSLSIDLWYPE